MDDSETGPDRKRRREGPLCPYIGTINRETLDFDREKLCSVTLSNVNVYGCLVCGQFFQGMSPSPYLHDRGALLIWPIAGRGAKSPAFHHAVEKSHNIFIHLSNGRVFCLPDGTEVVDSSLSDIRDNLSPKYTEEDASALETAVVCVR